MQDINQIVQKLSPLVKSYSRDMRLLIVDDVEANALFYEKSFGRYFSVCDIAKDGQEALDMWDKDRDFYDLIVTDVDMPRVDGLELVRYIREYSMDQSIIVITAVTDIEVNQDLAYYYIDGLLPKPINNKKLFVLLYRVLKKIDDKKEFDFYIKNLEDQVVSSIEAKNHFEYIIKKLQPLCEHQEAQDVVAMLKTLIHKKDDEITQNTKFQESKSKITEKNKSDLRYTVVDKISATEFNAQLDDTIIDKVENFEEVLDSFASIIYSAENKSPIETKQNLTKANEYLSEFIVLVDSMGIFPIISRSFENLIQFIDDIDIDSLSNKEDKSLLMQMLSAIEKDLSSWLKIVFIERNTQDIHYFDTSFSNSILEIESIFNNISEELDEDDDLEFF